MTPKPPPSPADRLRAYHNPLIGNELLAESVALAIEWPANNATNLSLEDWNARSILILDAAYRLSDHARLVEEIGRLRAQAEADRRELDDFRTFLLGAAKQMQARAALSPSQKEGGGNG